MKKRILKVTMKILDKYVIKQFLQTIFFGLIAFTLIFVVIDMMENLDDFIDQSVAAPIILHYYLVFSPDIIKLITPIAVLFGALFTAGKAAQLSELTAIKASGVSMYRFMLPFIITAFFISIFSIYFAGYIVPMANKTKLHIEMQYLKKGFNYTGSNIFFQDSPTRIVNISYFDNSILQANRVSIQGFDKNDITHMDYRIDAARMVYDTVSHTWDAKNGIKRIFYKNTQTARFFKNLKINNLNFTPSELLTKQEKPEEMNLTELKKSIETKQRAGNDVTNSLIEYDSRYSFAMASLIIVVFGLPISINKRRGGLAIQVGINILVTFIYLVFMQISLAFGKNGALNPLLTAWFANLIFLAAAIYNLIKMRQ
jgi:lipopolysaccharide export system permease protein